MRRHFARSLRRLSLIAGLCAFASTARADAKLVSVLGGRWTLEVPAQSIIGSNDDRGELPETSTFVRHEDEHWSIVARWIARTAPRELDALATSSAGPCKGALHASIVAGDAVPMLRCDFLRASTFYAAHPDGWVDALDVHLLEGASEAERASASAIVARARPGRSTLPSMRGETRFGVRIGPPYYAIAEQSFVDTATLTVLLPAPLERDNAMLRVSAGYVPRSQPSRRLAFHRFGGRWLAFRSHRDGDAWHDEINLERDPSQPPNPFESRMHISLRGSLEEVNALANLLPQTPSPDSHLLVERERAWSPDVLLDDRDEEGLPAAPRRIAALVAVALVLALHRRALRKAP